jgi:SH3-like domain-containing protein
MSRPLVFLTLALAACATPEPPTVGSNTALPVPRTLYTRGEAAFRTLPASDSPERFHMDQPVQITVLEEFDRWRKVRLEDSREGWIQASRVTIHPPPAP